MNKIKLFEAFQDTLKTSEQLDYDVNKKVRVIKECFTSSQFNLSYYRTQLNGKIIVEKNTTFSAANKYKKYGKTAVLNFANPVNPGGGVEIGAMAQEQCLCRSSNLYLSLKSPVAIEEYYNHNKKNKSAYLFSDRIVYSEGITVFKSDDDIPVYLPRKDWFQVDVITCAAPYLGKGMYADMETLKEVFKQRIKNIFEAAIDYETDVLILGAFGCGAFENPPELVARAFYEVILENHYHNLFKYIVFAIKGTVNSASENDCPNIAAFRKEFDHTCYESEELSRSLVDFVSMPIRYGYEDSSIELVSEQSGVIIVLSADTNTIGRGVECNITCKSVYISRIHARIIRRKEKWIIIDNGSRNGTKLNNNKLIPSDEYELSEGDRIELARSESFVVKKITR